MSNGTAFVMFVALIAGWAFGWANISNWVVRRHGWRRAFGHLAGCGTGLFSALGMFCLVGALFDGNPDISIRIFTAILGLVLLSPFIHLWRKGRAVRETTSGIPAVSTPQQSSPKAPSLAPVATATSAPARTQDTTLPCTFMFSYRGQDGEYSQRTVDVDFVSRNSDTGLTYLDGFCHDRLENRTFRTDRILGDLTDMETGELVPVAHLLSTVPPQASMDYKPPAPAPHSGTGRKWQTAVFFAGFRGGKLSELEGLADAAGWQIRWNISPTVDYVVRNGSAGKKQLEEAESLGVSVIDEATFRALAC